MLLLLKMPSFVMQMMTKIRASLGIRPDSTATSERSALVTLVNIRRKALLSSVGFRKRMTSRSPRRLICDSSALRSSISDLFDFWWEILSHFFDHSSIDINQFKQEDATASVYRMFWCFKPLLTPQGKGPFSGCYWITSFEWPQITRLCI